ncbi:MAG TPA: DMT family transporter [Clostridiales bacterium]|nr:DMT family transporter [Clostridiales bacterium]
MDKILSNERYKAILFLVLASILWSTGGILIKLVDWNPIAIAGSRSLISSIVVLLYLKKPKITWSMAQIGGALSYTATVMLFVAANKLTTAANAILLQFTAPIFVAILGLLILKEKIRSYDYIAIIVVFGGMLLFFIDDVGGGSMLGNTLAVISGFFLACVTIALRFQKDGSPVETTFLGNLLTFIVSIPFIVKGLPDLKSILAIIVLGVFQLGIAYILYALAIKHLKAIEAILITVIEPILNPIWVFLFAGEKPSLYAVIGGLIVIITVTVRSIIVSKESATKDQEGTEVG